MGIQGVEAGNLLLLFLGLLKLLHATDTAGEVQLGVADKGVLLGFELFATLGLVAEGSSNALILRWALVRHVFFFFSFL